MRHFHFYHKDDRTPSELFDEALEEDVIEHKEDGYYFSTSSFKFNGYSRLKAINLIQKSPFFRMAISREVDRSKKTQYIGRL